MGLSKLAAVATPPLVNKPHDQKPIADALRAAVVREGAESVRNFQGSRQLGARRYALLRLGDIVPKNFAASTAAICPRLWSCMHGHAMECRVLSQLRGFGSATRC